MLFDNSRNFYLKQLVSGSHDVMDLNFGTSDSTIKLARQVSQEQEAIAASGTKAGTGTGMLKIIIK